MQLFKVFMKYITSTITFQWTAYLSIAHISENIYIYVQSQQKSSICLHTTRNLEFTKNF